MLPKATRKRIEKLIKPYRVTRGKDFRLKDFDPGEKSRAIEGGSRCYDLDPIARAQRFRTSQDAHPPSKHIGSRALTRGS